VLVHATWQRAFPGVSVRAFLDHSYLIDFAFAGDKPPFLTVGWYRWHPDFLELNSRRPHYSLQPPPQTAPAPPAPPG
jgi:hypothetical protein